MFQSIEKKSARFDSRSPVETITKKESIMIRNSELMEYVAK